MSEKVLYQVSCRDSILGPVAVEYRRRGRGPWKVFAPDAPPALVAYFGDHPTPRFGVLGGLGLPAEFRSMSDVRAKATDLRWQTRSVRAGHVCWVEVPDIPAPEPEPEEVDVDLRWSCWSAHPATWEQEHYKDVLNRMRAALKGTGPALRIRTAPKKEIRSGIVTIRKGWVEARFSFEIDDEWMQKYGEYLEPDEFYVEGEIKVRSFRRLLAEVDKLEERLIEKEGEMEARLLEWQQEDPFGEENDDAL